MNRRNFLSGVFGGVTAAGLIVAAKPAEIERYAAELVPETPLLPQGTTIEQRRKYGLVTVASHRAHLDTTGETLHVYVNGIDVTFNCCEADDINGYAHILCKDPEHHRQLDAMGAAHVDSSGLQVCRLSVMGDVVIAPGPPLETRPRTTSI